MNLTALLDSCSLEHAPGADGVRNLKCPTCGRGAATFSHALDDSGDFCLTCRVCKSSGTTRYTAEEFRRAFGNGKADKARDEEGPSAEALTTPRFTRSDAGNAEAFAFLFQDLFRFVAEGRSGGGLVGRWHCWDEKRWREDKRGAAERAMLDTVRERLRWAAELVGVDRDEAALEAKWATSSQSARRIRDALTVAASMRKLVASPDRLDSDPWALNVSNGTVDLRTGLLPPHDPADLITRLAPVRYDAQSDCPRWEAFLSEVFGDDAEVIAFVQRAVGYSLTGDTREQVLFFLHGTGCNGKSTFLTVLKRLLGDYQRNADFASFTFRREQQASVRDDLAILAGTRLVTASEPTAGTRFSEGLVKQLTGGDSVTARHLYGRHFDFTPQFKLWLAANHRPTVRDTSPAFWRRVHLIPFTVSFLGREDPKLSEALTEELPGILQWALLGCLEWQRYGLRPPDAVRAATATYRAEEDTIGSFLGDCTESDSEATCLSARLYEAYCQWAEQNGERPAGRRIFGEALNEHGIERGRVAGGLTSYRGIRLCE